VKFIKRDGGILGELMGDSSQETKSILSGLDTLEGEEKWDLEIVHFYSGEGVWFNNWNGAFLGSG